MLRVVYSQKTEALAEAFVQQAQRQRAQLGAFSPLHVVVPNRNVDAYLRREMAERTGLAIHLEASFLGAFVADLERACTAPLFVPDRAAIEGALLARLLDVALLQHVDFKAVSEWISAGGAEPRSTEARRVEMASSVAALFESYSHYRASMLAGWLSSDAARADETERWQRRLYRDLFGVDGWFAAERHGQGRRGVTLDAFAASMQFATAPVPHVAVFGFSYLAPSVLTLLHRLAEYTDVVLYTLNPCREYWEDARKPRSQDAALAVDDNPLLSTWGAPGREYVKMLDALTDYAHDDRFLSEQVDSSLLARLQHDVLERAVPASLDVATQDASLQIVACPSPRREAEWVAQEIWKRVQQSASTDRPLGFHEIAVLVNVNERDRYVPELRAALARTHDVAHAVVDLPLSSTSAFAFAAQHLLGLAETRLGRSDLLALFTHSSFLARFTELDAQAIVSWVSALGVVDGADARDRNAAYQTHDRYHWDQALRRLALGAVHPGRDGFDDHALAFAETSYVPFEDAAKDRAPAALFGAIVRSLLSDVMWARTAHLTMAQWTKFFLAMVDVYLGAPTPEEERHRISVREAIVSLDALGLGDTSVSYFLALALVRERLADVQADGAPSGRQGVVISSLLPMRALPFRVVFAVGLNEGSFPASDRLAPHDLRSRYVQAGDVSPKARDRYLLLEALTSARDAFVATYTERRTSTGDPLEPSPVLRELERVVVDGYGAKHALLSGMALFAHQDEPLVEFAATVHRREAGASRIAQRLNSARALGADIDGWQHFAQGVPASARSRIEAVTGPVFAPLARTSERALVERVALSHVSGFLRSPLQASARVQLGLYDAQDDDPLAPAHEPFSLDSRERTVALRRAAEASLRATHSRMDAFVKEVDQMAVRGLGPSGVYAAAQAERDGQVLASWLKASNELDPSERAAFVHHVLGADVRHESDVAHAALRLNVQGHDIWVRGRTALFHRDQNVAVVLDVRSKQAGKDGTDTRVRHAVDVFVEHAALVAAGAAQPGALQIHRFHGDGTRATTRVQSISKEDAQAWLSMLVSELVSVPHPYLLPYEAVVRWKTRDEESLTDIIAHLVDDYVADPARSGFSCVRGAVPRPLSYVIPTEEVARELALRRFGPLFDRLAAEADS